MVTHTHPQDFVDTIPAPPPDHHAPRRRRAAAAEDGLPTPYRLVALVAWVVAVTLLLASIAGVAQSQVARGENFQYASPERSTSALAAAYSSRVSRQALERADADAVAALAVR